MSFGKAASQDKDKTTVKELRSATSASSAVTAFLGQDAKVVGTMNFNGQVELDGYVEGEINSKDKLTIGENAVINAKINGTEVLVRGTVNGDISASKRLALKKPAKVVGNISCSNLSIEEGVIFEGQSSMAKAGADGASEKTSKFGDKVGASA